MKYDITLEPAEEISKKSCKRLEIDKVYVFEDDSVVYSIEFENLEDEYLFVAIFIDGVHIFSEEKRVFSKKQIKNLLNDSIHSTYYRRIRPGAIEIFDGWATDDPEYVEEFKTTKKPTESVAGYSGREDMRPGYIDILIRKKKKEETMFDTAIIKEYDVLRECCCEMTAFGSVKKTQSNVEDFSTEEGDENSVHVSIPYLSAKVFRKLCE